MRSPLPQLAFTYTARFNGEPIPYRLIVSHRARSWRLSIHPHTGLSVVVPARSALCVETLLDAHAEWIQRSLKRSADRPVPRPIPLADGSLLPYRGTVLRLEVVAAGRAAPGCDLGAGTLRVRSAGPERLPTAVEAWYRRQADGVFRERLDAVNAVSSYRFARVSIRDQRTRWGSCSATGNLSFNWRLLLAPPAVLDSVVAHELTHLADRTHAASFWRLLARLDPAYDAHRRWLRRYGAWLTLGCDPPPPVGL